MKNSEYWRGRFSLLEHSTYKTAQAALREIEALYRQALYRTRKELDSWCARFADDNGVSLTEARRLLGTKELEEFRWDVTQYIEMAQKAGLDETWQRQLRNASTRVHVSRLEAVETQIRQQIEELYAGQETQLAEAVRRAADDAYTGTLQEAAKGLDVRFKTVSLDKTQLDALTAKAWTTDGRTFRDRCWTNKNALVQAVHKGLTQGLLRGDSPAQLTDAIAKQFDVDRYKAGRLVYTETAYYSALAEKQGFKDLGVKKVEIIGTLDGSTCSICGQLDGKEIPLAQYEPGVTVPPFHPRCRCTTAPVIPEDFADGLRIARDEDGEQYYVPSGTKWTEWKKGPPSQMLSKLNYSDSISPTEQESIEKELAVLPQWQRDKAESIIDKVVLLSKDAPGSGYEFKTKTLYVHPERAAGDMIHEYGHALEISLDLIHNKEYINIRRSGLELSDLSKIMLDSETFTEPVHYLMCDKFVSVYQGQIYETPDYGIFKPDSFEVNENMLKEYFSEGYRAFYQEPNLLKRKDPLLYAFIEELKDDQK